MNCVDELLYKLLDKKNAIMMASDGRKPIRMVVYISKRHFSDIVDQIDSCPLRPHDCIQGNTLHGEVFHVVDDDNHPRFRIFQL